MSAKVPFLKEMRAWKLSASSISWSRRQALIWYFSVGAPVNLKIEGITHPADKMPALRPGQVKQLAYSVMNERQISELEAKMEMNLSISAENLGASG